eukprot:gene10321-10478_t
MAADVSFAEGPRRIILWFRNDLRLRDNAVVYEAVQKIQANEFNEVLPVYCYDPRFFALSPWGLSKTGPHRAAFLQQSVADLQASLQQLGSGLLVAVGKPEEVIAAALEDVPAGHGLVLAQEEVTSEELAVDAKVTRAVKGKAKLVRHWGPSLYHIDDVPFGEGLSTMPNVFTPFREKVEKQCKVRPELPSPKSGELPLAVTLSERLQQQMLMSKEEQARCNVQIGVDYPMPIPASRLARPHNDGGYRVGGNTSFKPASRTPAGAGRGGNGARGGSKGYSSKRAYRPRSEFEMYG